MFNLSTLTSTDVKLEVQMDSKNDTWKDRHELVPYAYGLNVIHMLTVQTVAHGEYLTLNYKTPQPNFSTDTKNNLKCF